MFDFITDPLTTMMTWLGYGVVATFIATTLFFFVVIPLTLKFIAIAFAKTLIVETTKIVGNSRLTLQLRQAIQSVDVATQKITKDLNRLEK